MARTTTFHMYKTRVGYGTAASFGSTPTSLVLATFLGELKSVSRTGQMVAKNSAKHLESPDGYDELIPGFGTGGSYELTFNYHPALERLLNTLAPDPSFAPTAGGPNIGDPPGYGRNQIFIVDRYLNFEYANVIWDPPTKTVDAEGVGTLNVTVTVAEGKPKYVAAAGAAANPGNYSAPV